MGERPARHIALILLALAGVFITTPAQAKRVALVIGNSAYKHTAELQNPRNDAADMAATLKGLGFEVVKGFDLDKPAMDRKVRDFSKALSGADTGLFYFAGHGLQVNNSNFLAPVDAELSSAAALEFEMVRLDLIQRIMEGEAKTNILFLDACRNNPLSRNLARAMGTRAAGIGTGLAAVESGVGTLISFATQPGNVALDGKGRNSPYAGSLARHLSLASDDLSAILISVRNDVMKETQNKQVPWEHSALTGRFYFKESVGPPVPPSLARPFERTEAAEAWAAAKDTRNPIILEAFIKRFGDTFYGDMARARLDELRQEAAAVVPPAPPKSHNARPVEPAVGVDAAEACDGLEIAVGITVGQRLCVKPGAGISFRDCWGYNDDNKCGPEMLAVPAGSFLMGSPPEESGRLLEEDQRQVSVEKPFAIGRYEATFAEWDACVSDGGCSTNPKDQWGRGRMPVMRVSWTDAQDFVRWLSRKTKHDYRLPTQVEWEYAARAGALTAFATGQSLTSSEANIDPGTHAAQSAHSKRDRTVPVGSFKPNKFGLYDVHGNVWEWTADCYASMKAGPTPSAACTEYVLRGGSWASELRTARFAANQARGAPNLVGRDLGFRVVRLIEPNAADRRTTIREWHYVDDTRPPDAYLALLKSPKDDGSHVTDMPNGTLLEVLEKGSNDWWRVRTSQGQEGWALSRDGDRVWIHCCRSSP